MAIDSYMAFRTYTPDGWLDAESQVDIATQSDDLKESQSKFTAGKVFEIKEYNFDIEQTLNIGSQSKGAGAGRVVFNPFSITRSIDRASPILFGMACSGTPFKEVLLGLRKGGGGQASGKFFMMYRFGLVAVKTVSYAHDDESPTETVTFEYGGLQMFYGMQKPNGSIDQSSIAGGWDRTTNKLADTPDAFSKMQA